MFPTMRQEGAKKADAKAGKAEFSDNADSTASGDNSGFFTPNDKIEYGWAVPSGAAHFASFN